MEYSYLQIQVLASFKQSYEFALKGDFNKAAFLAKQGSELGNQLYDALIEESKKELA